MASQTSNYSSKYLSEKTLQQMKQLFSSIVVLYRSVLNQKFPKIDKELRESCVHGLLEFSVTGQTHNLAGALECVVLFLAQFPNPRLKFANFKKFVYEMITLSYIVNGSEVRGCASKAEIDTILVHFLSETCKFLSERAGTGHPEMQNFQELVKSLDDSSFPKLEEKARTMKLPRVHSLSLYRNHLCPTCPSEDSRESKETSNHGRSSPIYDDYSHMPSF